MSKLALALRIVRITTKPPKLRSVSRLFLKIQGWILYLNFANTLYIQTEIFPCLQ